MRRIRLKSLTLPTLALLAFNILPQLQLRPLKYSLLAAVFLGYRLMMELSGLKAPPRFVLILAQAVSALLIWQEHKTLFGGEPSGILLTLLACLKTYELNSKRDYFVTINLCVLVLMSYLLTDQSLLLTIYLFIDVFLMITLLYALETETWSWRNLKSYAKPTLGLVFKAVPLLVLCFFLFPRFTTGFGAGAQTQSKTGMTDELKPGSISNLMNSDELVFRASYLDGEIPTKSLRYWRGAVLDVSKGLNWQRSKVEERRRVTNRYFGNEELEIHLEPGFDRFLYAPEQTLYVTFSNESVRVIQRPDGTYELTEPLKTRERYFVKAGEIAGPSPELEPYLTNEEKPSPELLAHLQKLKGTDDTDSIRKVVASFREGYTYSLTPPPAANLDEFLFKNKTGFCEHYAAATATMLRELGIPARVITGFQGGTASFLENYVTVRANDAHAWVEYYDRAHARWRKLDPTAQVAPARLAFGSDAYLAGTAGWLTSWLKLRAVVDEVDAAWVGFLLRFDLTRQKELLAKFGMEAAIFRALPVFLLLAIVLILALLYFLEARRREPLTRDERLYRELQRILRAKKFPRASHEGPADWFDRIAKEKPDLGRRVEPLLEPLLLARFARAPLNARQLNEIAKGLKRLKRYPA